MKKNPLKIEIPEGYLFSKKDLSRLIAPLVVDMFLTFFVGMLDSIMVSGVSEGAVSGISLVDQTVQLVIMVFSAMATGGTVVAGQNLGNRDRETACRSVQQLFWMMLITGVAAGAVLLCLRHAILSHVFGSITQEVYDYADKYLVIVSFSLPMLAVNQAGGAIFRTMGNSKVPMYISAMMNVLNFCGNALFIYKFGMDTDGAGISTLISRTAAAVVVTVLLMNQELPLHYEKTIRFRPDSFLIKKILYIGVPNGIENGMFQLGKIMLLSLVSAYGTSAITANAITQNMAQLQLLPAFAVNMAVITVISRVVGANDKEQALFYNRTMLKMMYKYLLVVAWAIYLLMPLVLKLYHASGETSDLTMQMITWHTVGAVSLWPLAFEVPQALRSSGDVKFTMVTSLATMWVIRIVGAYVLARQFGFGALAPWIAMVMDFVCRTFIYRARWRSGKWMEKRIV